MAVTFHQAAIDQRMDMSPTEGGLIQLLDYVSPVFRDAPAIGIDGFWDDFEQIATLGTSSWRALNETISESTGTTKSLREYVKLIAKEVKIDVELLNGPKGPTTKRRQIEMSMQSAANEIERAIFEGSESNNVREMVGFRDRLDSGNLVLNASGGGQLTLDKLREARSVIPFSRVKRPGMKRGEGVKICAYMNPLTYNKIDSLVKATSGAQQIQTDLDEMGRQVKMWDDMELVVVRQTGALPTSTSQLLWFDEDPGDGTSDCASIYIVAWGEDLCHLLYRKPSTNGRMLRTFEREEMESAPQYLLRFSGAFGLEIKHPLAAVRLHGIHQP